MHAFLWWILNGQEDRGLTVWFAQTTSPQDMWLFMHRSGNDCAYEFSWQLGGGCMCQRRPRGEFEGWMTSYPYFRILKFDKYWLDEVEETHYFSHWFFKKKQLLYISCTLTFRKDDCTNNEWTWLFSFHSFRARQEVPLDHISFLF